MWVTVSGQSKSEGLGPSTSLLLGPHWGEYRASMLDTPPTPRQSAYARRYKLSSEVGECDLTPL